MTSNGFQGAKRGINKFNASVGKEEARVTRKQTHLTLELVDNPDIVGIEERHECPTGGRDPEISGCRYSRVLLPYRTDAALVQPEYFVCSVGGPVIYDNALDRAVGLSEHAFN